MHRFTQVSYDKASNTATIEAGLKWLDVYSALQAQGVTVLGGRIEGTH